MADQTTITLKDKIAIVASLVAVSISLVTFFRDQIFGQHILRASVVAIEEPSGKLQADILIINPGKHVEILYQAQFIFSEDLSTGGGSLSEEIVGPLVIEPGKAAVLRLETTAPSIRALREGGTIKDPWRRTTGNHYVM